MASLYIRHELLRHQPIRLATFHNWNSTLISGTILADCGFYYEGKKDEIYCFSCNLKLKNIKEKGDIFKQHRYYSPLCDFLNGTDVSIYRGSSNLEVIGYPTVNSLLNLYPTSMEKEESYSLNDPTFILSKMRKRESIDLFATIKVPKIEDSRMILNINDFFCFLKNEENRLETFEYGNWQKLLSHDLLAAKGWFYTLLNDIVQCCFCRIVICGLYNHEILDIVHIFYSPKCVFNKTKNDFNIPKVIQYNNLDDKLLCKICFENEISIILNCFHLILCNECARNKNMKKCPICCKPITQRNKVYF